MAICITNSELLLHLLEWIDCERDSYLLVAMYWKYEWKLWWLYYSCKCFSYWYIVLNIYLFLKEKLKILLIEINFAVKLSVSIKLIKLNAVKLHTRVLVRLCMTILFQKKRLMQSIKVLLPERRSIIKRLSF